MHWLLRICSVVILVFTGLFFVEDNLVSNWRAAQSDYQAALTAAAETADEVEYARAFSVELRQIDLPELGRVDRCVSCHVGVENPQAATFPQPLGAHPKELLSHHDVDRMGCTICHDGQGRATAAGPAHGWGHEYFWDKPVLHGALLESTCYRCHVEPLASSPTYAAGRALFETRGCLGCHRVGGDGLSLGPDLTLVGDRSFAAARPTPEHHELIRRFDGNVNAAYLYEAVRFPGAQPPGSLMVDGAYDDEEALALTVYLKSFVAPVSAQKLVPRAAPRPPGSLVEEGGRLFGRYCAGCHGVDGRGGVKNPNAVTDTIPQLDLTAERLMLFEPEDAQRFVAYLSEHSAPPEDAGAIDLPRASVTLVQFSMVRGVIVKGNPSGRKDPAGPTPIDMPAWGALLDEQGVTAIVAFLVARYPWDE